MGSSPAAVAETDLAEVEANLPDLLKRGRLAWPTVTVAPRMFAEYLASRLPRQREVLSALASAHTDDLYVAGACAAGDSQAIGAVERAFFGDCDAALARMSPDPAFAQEVKQRVREKLFVGGDGRAPRITEYSGLGDLRSFLRVSMMREGISLRRKGRREVLSGDAGLVEGWDTADPELLHLRRTYAAQFEHAFREALDALTSEERNVLRYHYVHRLSIDHIGAIYDLHRVSASRRLNKARSTLVLGTRQRLAARLDAGSTTARSVMRLIQSAIDLSLRQALGDASRS